MSRLSDWFEEKYLRLVALFGLSGSDKRLSFSKTFGLLILGSYLFNTNLPASVAIALIISAHGTKVLLEAIKSGVFKLSANDSSVRVTTKTETKTHNVSERVGWDSQREYQES